MPDRGQLLVGGAGYSYDDWVGPVYPPGTKSKDYLVEYSKYFPFVELNFTYYRMPAERTIAGIVHKAPGMLFAAKATSVFTHERDAGEAEFKAYRQGMAPIIDDGRLVACLLQFPTSFHNTDENRAWLEHLREGFADLPLVAEFRAADWVDNTVPKFLSALDIGWCAVDEPRFKSLMPPVVAVTGSVSYLRLHGRNYDKWWQHDEAWERYDYLYTEEQLQEWVPKIERMMEYSETTAVVFNNHYRGQGVENGQMLLDLLPPRLKKHTLMVEDPPERVESQEWKAKDEEAREKGELGGPWEPERRKRPTAKRKVAAEKGK
ncbi:MAG TPA: DUF72 domain-containing protein [bacterium]|nr:DUF72 domain-containing protein [bacterium]